MFTVHTIPAFADNYIWALQPAGSTSVALVDPGDGAAALRFLRASGFALEAILITHHHRDHVGGIGQLLEEYGAVPVLGPAKEKIPYLTRALQEGDMTLLPGLQLQVLEVPGHTAGHIAYYADACLFCGDTLFAAGCGRVFDGTFEQLAASLRRIAALPSETRIYCAHEYTVANLGFAKWVEPDNAELLARDEADMARAEYGQPTVPSLLAIELATNPFLRTAEPTVIAAVEAWAGHALSNPTAVFTALRQWKDRDYD